MSMRPALAQKAGEVVGVASRNRNSDITAQAPS